MTDTIITLAVVLLAAWLVIRILKHPMKFIFKVLINSVIGFIVLALLNNLLRVGITMVWYNYLLVGFLGVPGLILVVVLQFFL